MRLTVSSSLMCATFFKSGSSEKEIKERKRDKKHTATLRF